MYDAYKQQDAHWFFGLYDEMASKSLSLTRGFFHIFMNTAVFASGIAILFSAVALIIAARQGPQRLNEVKGRLAKILIISILIFTVTGAVTFISGLGLD